MYSIITTHLLFAVYSLAKLMNVKEEQGKLSAIARLAFVVHMHLLFKFSAGIVINM